jgi:N-acetylglucosamine kinase-like BadF-type ATPase
MKAKTMKMRAALPAAALLVLAACGGGEAEKSADRLEEAAEQSDPAAAEVLQNAADEVSAGNMSAQEAMQAAGNAQAQTVGGQAAPPSMQAQPNRTGQQTPPPKVPTGPGSAEAQQGNSQ